jgi:energy-coupling factor transporter ATP-binding protein EcfA2
MELLADIHRQGNTVLLVTHNPELTRYANRVIYMHDGMIAGDEKTAIGDMAKGARKTYFGRRQMTEDDLAAGVSALMHNIPGAEAKKVSKKRKARRKKRTARKKKARSR